MYADRLPLYRQLEEARASKVIALVNGDRPGLETQLGPDIVDCLVHHLDRIDVSPRISLLLYTCGGQPLVAWSIVNLLRQYCDEFEVLVPAKALSSGTLICLGADRIVMTRQATLGPIDPSINGPLNPPIAGDSPYSTAPVSVEAVNGYIEFARAVLGDQERGMTAVLERLTGQIHPLVLGGAYRSRMQIRMLAKRLLGRQIKDEASVERVLNFLCSDSGSHDYTIYRREARDELGLRVEDPGGAGYRVLRALYEDIVAELEMRGPLDHRALLGKSAAVNYVLRRGLVESLGGGSHVNVTRGRIWARPLDAHRGADTRSIAAEQTFEGWCHEQV